LSFVPAVEISSCVKRKGDNNDTMTGASKQSKSSPINGVEIVHSSPASKACNCKSETKSRRHSEKKCQKIVAGTQHINTDQYRFYALNYFDFTLLSSAKMTISKIESMTENYPEFPVANLN
jgi:hypothetical protein